MSKQRKQRLSFTVEQRLDYAKLLVNESYTNQQIMDIHMTGSIEIQTKQLKFTVDPVEISR